MEQITYPKQEFGSKLWPKKTFLDFQKNLSTAPPFFVIFNPVFRNEMLFFAIR